jgi:hypothetical protein
MMISTLATSQNMEKIITIQNLKKKYWHPSNPKNTMFKMMMSKELDKR